VKARANKAVQTDWDAGNLGGDKKDKPWRILGDLRQKQYVNMSSL
jgi:hypothetical protein